MAKTLRELRDALSVMDRIEEADISSKSEKLVSPENPSWKGNVPVFRNDGAKSGEVKPFPKTVADNNQSASAAFKSVTSARPNPNPATSTTTQLNKVSPTKLATPSTTSTQSAKATEVSAPLPKQTLSTQTNAPVAKPSVPTQKPAISSQAAKPAAPVKKSLPQSKPSAPVQRKSLPTPVTKPVEKDPNAGGGFVTARMGQGKQGQQTFSNTVRGMRSPTPTFQRSGTSPLDSKKPSGGKWM